MIMRMFAVQDAAVKAFLRPFFEPTRMSAIRSFTDAVNEEGSHLGKHASDFTLFEMGEFDDGSGLFVALPTPVRVVSAVECRADDLPAGFKGPN